MSLLTTTTFLPVLIIIALALVSARFMVRNTSVSDTHEFASIDGLRGFLALFVFIHHSVYWFNYSHLQGWSFFGSMTYMNLGQTSICFFFMLSGFLFIYKLLEARDRELDWLKLYCSRFMRLTPLYLVSIVIIIVTIAFESGFTQLEDVAALRSHITDWVLFIIPGHPDINGHPNTHLMISGVIWTLSYEWYFYFCLPAIAVLVGSKSKPNSGIWLILSCICIATFSRWALELTFMYGFLGGAFAAYAVRTPWLRALFQGKGANWVLLAGIYLSFCVLDNSLNFTRLLVLSICMAFVACGASLFGILSCRAARALSTVSYGVYLLHGLVLYFVLTHGIDVDIVTQLTEPQFWLIVFCCTPIIIGLSTLSWYWIEWPAIQFASKLAGIIKSLHSPAAGAAKVTEPKLDPQTADIAPAENTATAIPNTETEIKTHA